MKPRIPQPEETCVDKTMKECSVLDVGGKTTDKYSSGKPA